MFSFPWSIWKKHIRRTSTAEAVDENKTAEPTRPYWPSARMYRFEDTYTLSAFIFDESKKPQYIALQELYLRTRSKAIVRYCLYGHDNSIVLQDTVRLDLPEAEREKAVLRFRRCGAVTLDFKKDTWGFGSFEEEQSIHLFQQHVWASWKVLFGWPAPTSEKIPEAVWVLHTTQVGDSNPNNEPVVSKTLNKDKVDDDDPSAHVQDGNKEEAYPLAEAIQNLQYIEGLVSWIFQEATVSRILTRPRRTRFQSCATPTRWSNFARFWQLAVLCTTQMFESVQKPEPKICFNSQRKEGAKLIRADYEDVQGCQRKKVSKCVESRFKNPLSMPRR